MMVTPEACKVRTTSHMPLRNSTSTPAVGSSRNRICGSCDSAFAIITRRFMPPDSVMIFESFLSHSDRSQDFFDDGRVARFAEQPAAEGERVPHRLEHVGGELLRHQSDLGARRAEVAHRVVAV